MRIVDAGYEILDPLNGEEILKKIERVARVCYKSEDKITEGSAEKMVRALIKSNHMAMLEHYSFSVKFICDRGVSHEIVRHRVASYAQESTRYCNYSKGNVGDVTFIRPCFFTENFVLMVIGVDADHNVYVLDYVKERLTFNTQLNTIIDYGRNKFPMVERIGVETVAYQKSLAQELRRLSLLPIININTSKDKVTRAMRRSANFENHKVYFREGMDDLEECLLLFPEVDHDDLFDALDFAMTMADGGNEIRVLKREDFRI